jgi:hypothetical protein
VASGQSRANEASIGTSECFKAWMRAMRIFQFSRRSGGVSTRVFASAL